MSVALSWLVSLVGLLWIILWPGWGLLRLARVSPPGPRYWHMAWILGSAASAPLFYISGRAFGFSGAAVLITATLAGAILLVMSRRGKPRVPLDPLPRLPWGIKLALAGVALSIALPYAEWHTTRDIYANSVTDWHGRQATIWSLERYGLPAQDALFYPGKSVAMYYPSGGYLAVAAAASLGGANVPQALPFAIFAALTFLAMALLVAETATRVFGSARAGRWAAILATVGGLDALVNLSLAAGGRKISFGHVAAWASATDLRIDSLYSATLWACPHVVAVCGAFVLLRWLPLNARRRPGVFLVATILLAGMFYFSPYVTLAMGAYLAAVLLGQALRGRWRRWICNVSHLGASGILAAALALPLMLDLARADLSSGGGKLFLGVPLPTIHPIAAMAGPSVGRWGDLFLQVLLMLLPLVALGLGGWLLCRPRVRWRYFAGLMGWTIPLGVLMAVVVRSTGVCNDWGSRAPHLLQLSSMVLGGGMLAAAASWQRWKRVALYLLVAAGMSSTLWEIGTENLGRFFVQKPPQRYALFEASRFIRDKTRADAVVMIDPAIAGIDYARRWSDRRSLLASEVHGSMAYTDPKAMRKVKDVCRQVSHAGLTPDLASQLRELGATHVLLPISNAEAGAQSGVVFSCQAFVVVDLSRL
jgi:hypothetical protein